MQLSVRILFSSHISYVKSRTQKFVIVYNFSFYEDTFIKCAYLKEPPIIVSEEHNIPKNSDNFLQNDGDFSY